MFPSTADYTSYTSSWTLSTAAFPSLIEFSEDSDAWFIVREDCFRERDPTILHLLTRSFLNSNFRKSSLLLTRTMVGSWAKIVSYISRVAISPGQHCSRAY